MKRPWQFIAIMLAIMIGTLFFWVDAYLRCHKRGDDWWLARDALGFPVCVKVEYSR